MARVMPSQVVQTIDELFHHAKKDQPGNQLHGHPQLQGLLNLLNDVPDELISVSSADYADLVLARGIIDDFLAHSRARGVGGMLAHVKGFDVVTVIRRVLAKCSDQYPPPTATELLFIKDDELRENIGRDVGATSRALNNAEWKAATVLAGATIEALLHWRLQQPLPGDAAVEEAVAELVATKGMSRPDKNIDWWGLHHFIEVAAHLGLIKSDTIVAAKLAENFRNLIHPGRAARLAQNCDKGTAHSAIGALEHVIRDLGRYLSLNAAGGKGQTTR